MHSDRITARIVSIVVACIATGLAYGVFWAPVVQHHPSLWLTPTDLWYAVRSSHWIGWGGLSSIYANGHSELVTLPGFEILLLPVVALCSALGLSESAPWILPTMHPHAWLVIAPLTIASVAVPLFAADRIMRRLGIDRNRRTLIAALEACALWTTVAYWGHGEDALALGLALFALATLVEGRIGLAGWLLGAALSMQLFVVYLVPILVGLIGIRKSIPFLARAAVIPGFLLVTTSVSDFHSAMTQLLKQPAVPSANHPTPLMALASHVSKGLVSAGPARSIGMILAIGLGYLAWRSRQDLVTVMWLTSAALAVRCLLEPVAVAYYVAPAIAVALVVAGRSPRRLAMLAAAGAGLIVMTTTHHGKWTYWLSMTAISLVLLTIAWPGTASVSSGGLQGASNRHDRSDALEFRARRTSAIAAAAVSD